MKRIVLLSLCWMILQAGDAISPQDWQARLERIDQELADGRISQAQAAADELQALRVDWPSGSGAADPGLASAIRRGEPAQARRLIAALRRELTSTPGQAAAIDRQRLAALNAQRRSDVLARGGEVGSLPDLDLPEVPWLDRMRERVADWFESFGSWLRRLFGGGEEAGDGAGGPLWAWIAAGTAVTLIAAVAIYAIRRRPPPSTAPAPMALHGADEALALAADGWLAEGARQLAAGNRRAAVRAWYLGLLAATWERGLLHHRTGWTNWDYARALPQRWAGREPFHDLTRRFDAVWYGGMEDAVGVDAFAASTRSLIDTLRRAEAG